MNRSEPITGRPDLPEMENAFLRKDPTYDGIFFVAVRTTGIFCRPSCPSRPTLANVEFLPSARDCLHAGYRPCLRCHPLQTDGSPPPWVAALIARLEANPEARLQADDLRTVGVTPERARRWFQRHYGMTFAAWCRGHRLAGAFARLRQGASLDDAALGSGFESHSGFRDAFTRAFGRAPGRARRDGSRLVSASLESPLGPLLAVTGDDGLVLLEFTDRHLLERQLTRVRHHFEAPILPGAHPLLDQSRRELADYFAGRRRSFDVPLRPRGTPFQEIVWAELRRIPHGETISYETLAERIGRPQARRAVAQANGRNRLAILIPCHRVIGKDGSWTGYAGGLWRKRLLLELERTGRLPGQ